MEAGRQGCAVPVMEQMHSLVSLYSQLRMILCFCSFPCYLSLPVLSHQSHLFVEHTYFCTSSSLVSKVKSKNEAPSWNTRLILCGSNFLTTWFLCYQFWEETVTLGFKSLQCSGRVAMQCSKALILEYFFHQPVQGKLKSEGLKVHYNDWSSM